MKQALASYACNLDSDAKAHAAYLVCRIISSPLFAHSGGYLASCIAGSSPEALPISGSMPAAASVESVLQQQLQEARKAEQQRMVEEIIYLWCLYMLSEASMSLQTALPDDQPSSPSQLEPTPPFVRLHSQNSSLDVDQSESTNNAEHVSFCLLLQQPHPCAGHV